jgi:hypothetical protein
VHVSWQLDRADRAETARLADEVHKEDAELAEGVRTLGAALFRTPGRPGRCDLGGLDGADSSPLSWPSDPEHSRHPARLVAALEATAAGCDWLRQRWAELGEVLDAGRNWKPFDRVRAILLLGKQPLDVVADDRVLSIYLACHAMDPDGPDVCAEPLGELHRPETAARRERLAARFAAARAERVPRDAAGARSELRALVAAGVARAEALRGVRAAEEVDERADIAARLSYEAKVAVEWLRKHQVTCSRALFRTFDELRKLRRDFGADPAADEPDSGPPAPGPGAEEVSVPDPCEAPRVAVAPTSGPCEVTPRQEADAMWEADESPAPRPCEVIESDDLPATGSEPVAAEPVVIESVAESVADREASIMTNEAGGPAPTVTNEAGGPALSRGSAAVGPGAAGPALGPTDDRPGPAADGPAADRPTGAAPDDGAPVATNEASADATPDDCGRIATNEAISESGEVQRAGVHPVSREFPHLPLAVGADRSGPS